MPVVPDHLTTKWASGYAHGTSNPLVSIVHVPGGGRVTLNPHQFPAHIGDLPSTRQEVGASALVQGF